MLNKTVLSTAIACVLSIPAHAADSGNTSTQPTAKDKTAQSTDTVVVTATRTDTSLADTAASVTVISEEDIENNMVEDIDDLFKYTPGVTLETNSRQGVQSINIRGIEGNRIKVLVDGVAQANQYDSGALFINSSRVDIDTDMLKAVEIVKGAASSLQGSDAIGGIVAFKTKDPADILHGRDFGGYVKLNYSSSDHTFSESVAAAKQSGDWASLVAYTRRDGTEVDNFGEPNDQNNYANNLLIKLQYQVNPAHRVEFSGNVLRKRNDLNALEYNGYTNASGNDKTEQYQFGFRHVWDAEMTMADQVTWSLNWFSKEETDTTDRTSSSTDNVQQKVYLYSDKGIQFDSQLDKSFVTGKLNHHLIYGASFSYKDIKNINHVYNSTDDDETIFYIPNASETRYGLFAQDEIAVSDFIITPGVRFDGYQTDHGDTSANPSENDASDYKKYSDSAVTARLGAVYKLTQQHHLYAQISQGFRAPDFKELYYSYGYPPYYTSEPNPDLKAEKSLSYEAGWRYNTQATSNEFSLFYSDYDNFIDSTTTGSFADQDLVYQYVNIDKATIKGVEWSNTLYWDNFIPFEGFSSHVAAAYTEGKDGDGNPLNSVNPWNAVTGISYDSPNQWGSTINFSYTAKKRASDITDGYLPIGSATVVDITAYYKPIKALTLRAGVFNVTDEEYYHWNDVRSETSEDKDLSQPHRNFSITAKYEF